MTEAQVFQDVEVDLDALEWLATVSRRTAAILEQIAEDRRRAVATRLARCRGPFAEQVQDQVLRCAAEEVALAERCRRLAELALDAAVAARRDQVALLQLRTMHPAGPPGGQSGGEGW